MAATYCPEDRRQEIPKPGKVISTRGPRVQVKRSIAGSWIHLEKEERIDPLREWFRGIKDREGAVLASPYNQPPKQINVSPLNLAGRASSSTFSGLNRSVLKEHPREFLATITCTVFGFTLFCMVTSLILARPILAGDVGIVSLVLSLVFFLMTLAAPRNS